MRRKTVSRTVCRGCRKTCSVSVCKSGRRRRPYSSPFTSTRRNSSRDNLYLSNYNNLARQGYSRAPRRCRRCAVPGRPRVRDAHLARTRQGCGANNLNGSEVLAALRAQNLQVSAGILNQPPVPGHEAYQSTSRHSAGFPHPSNSVTSSSSPISKEG